MEIKLNENDVKGGCENEWEMVKTTLLIRFCKIYANNLPKRALSSFKISEFKALGSEIRRVLLYNCLLFDLFCFHVECSEFEGQIHLNRWPRKFKRGIKQKTQKDPKKITTSPEGGEGERLLIGPHWLIFQYNM